MSVLKRLAGAGILIAEMGESSPGEEPWVFAYRIGRKEIWWGGDAPRWVNDGEALLQARLQREIEARGWGWSVKGGQYPGQYVARIYAGKWGHVEAVQKCRASPALALAAALLAALEAPAGA